MTITMSTLHTSYTSLRRRRVPPHHIHVGTSYDGVEKPALNPLNLLDYKLPRIANLVTLPPAGQIAFRPITIITFVDHSSLYSSNHVHLL